MEDLDFGGHHSEESKLKISKNCGSKRLEVRKKLSIAQTGRIKTKNEIEKIRKSNTGKIRSLETRKLQSKIKKGIKLSQIHIENIKQSSFGKHNKGMTRSLEINQKISNSLKGKKYPERKKLSKEYKQYLSEIMKNISKILCPYCNSEYFPAPYKRWHGEKCKHL